MNEVSVAGAVVHLGNVVDVLRGMPAESVHCVVTSPPYWGLRAYKSEPQLWGGDDPACEHDWQVAVLPGISGGVESEKVRIKGTDNFQKRPPTASDLCRRCGAWRGELGLEPTPDMFVGHIVQVFREVRRVLRSDGTAWVNFGDCYNAGTNATRKASVDVDHGYWEKGGTMGDLRRDVYGLKPKDLVGMPWRVAFALQADGWYLRADIVWAKPNPMPESIRDRPTKSHEYLFLLSKSGRYFYDMDAIRERTGTEVTWEQWAIAEGRHAPAGPNLEGGVGAAFGSKKESFTHPAGRNKRTVWTIATSPYPEAHFATFPEALVEPCIKAGTSEEGCCATCGAPWRRVVENPRVPDELRSRSGGNGQESVHVPSGWDTREGGHGLANPDGWDGRREPKGDGADDRSRASAMARMHKADFHRRSTGSGQRMQDWRDGNPPRTVGWAPSCGHAGEPVPCTVLEPFAGSGTTLAVAKKLGRRAVGVELQPSYLPLIRRRLERASLPLLDELDFEAPRQTEADLAE